MLSAFAAVTTLIIALVLMELALIEYTNERVEEIRERKES